MAIQWTEDLAVGSTEIDAQHKALFTHVDTLLTACRERKGKEAISQTITFLEAYVTQHFTLEETLMRTYGYPDYEAHKAQHQKFGKEFAMLKDRLLTEGPGVQIILLVNKTVIDWLMQHIHRTDKDLGVFLHQKL